MTGRNWMVVERADGWSAVSEREAETAIDADSLETLIEAIQQASRERAAPRCLLAPASNSCYFVPLGPVERGQTRDRAASIYRLESHLPIDAEAMVADFMSIPEPGGPEQLTAVALEAARWLPIVTELEQAGIGVTAIVPAAVLQVRAIVESMEAPHPVLVLLFDRQHCDWIEADRRGIHAWKRLGSDPHSLAREQRLNPHQPVRATVNGQPSTDLSSQSGTTELIGSWTRNFTSAEELMRQSATRLFRDQWGDWFDLRRDSLGPADPWHAVRTPVRIAVVAMVISLLTVSLAGWWRMERLQARTEELHAAQELLFREAFPGVSPPAAVLRRVRSEHAIALGSRGEASGVELPTPAPSMLRTLLVGLTKDVRYRVSRIQIRNGSLQLDVQVRNLRDAGLLATALAEQGFDVAPPGTNQKDADTYESTLVASWRRSTDEP